MILLDVMYLSMYVMMEVQVSKVNRFESLIEIGGNIFVYIGLATFYV